jgi:hypothetical protein
MENFYGRVVFGDVLYMKKIRSGCTKMVTEVSVDVIKEVKTRTSKLRKYEHKLGGKPTLSSEGQRHWMDPG